MAEMARQHCPSRLVLRRSCVPRWRYSLLASMFVAARRTRSPDRPETSSLWELPTSRYGLGARLVNVERRLGPLCDRQVGITVCHIPNGAAVAKGTPP